MDSSSVRITDSYPIELHHVRALFLQKQHRRCITACRDLLGNAHGPAECKEQPLRRTFLCLYLALAHDELARTIHNYSRTKIPAIRLAEQLYRDATLSLPSAELCAEPLSKPELNTVAEEPQDAETSPSLLRSNSDSALSDDPPQPIYSPVFKRISSESYPPRSPPVDSPLAALSDQEDDLESHASYSQIMTPNRLSKLQRDHSSMSLIQPQTPPRPQSFAEDSQQIAQQQSLGEPSYSRQSRTPPQLPRLDTAALVSSAVRKQLRTPSEQNSPELSPISPLGSESVDSDAATISPVSPSTPTAAFPFDGQTSTNGDVWQTKLQILGDHLASLRTQLDRHVELLNEEGQRVIATQSERSASKHLVRDAGQSSIQPLPSSQSFWSFTPKNVKEREKRDRITSGRQRGWQRSRFNPAKYQRLAELAMQEL